MGDWKSLSVSVLPKLHAQRIDLRIQLVLFGFVDVARDALLPEGKSSLKLSGP